MSNYIIYTDESEIPFGQYKGQKLKSLPAGYLLWLYRNDKAGSIKNYIQGKFDELMAQDEKDKKKQNGNRRRKYR